MGPLPDGNFTVGRLGHTLRFGAGDQSSYVVLHTIVGSIDAADARFRDPSSHTSAHYGVGLDGGVVQWVNESDTAYHAGKWDLDLASIGIQHEDGGDVNSTRTDALYASSGSLVREVCLRYGIPISRRWVIRHSEVPGVKSTCPNTLDVDRIVAMATGRWQPAPPAAPTAVAVDSAVTTLEASPGASPATDAAPMTEPPPMQAAVIEPPPPPTAPQPVMAPSQPAPPRPRPMGETIRDIGSALYSDPTRWRDAYRAIDGVVAEAPALAGVVAAVNEQPPAAPPPPPPPSPPPQDAAPVDVPVAPEPANADSRPPPPPPGEPAQPPPVEKHRGGSEGFIFFLQMVYLAVLAALAYVYFTNRSWIPLGDTLGPLPIAVPWYGALGGVLISLVGVTYHRNDWEDSYRFWHWARPLLGASFGSISVLMFQAGIVAVGSVPATTSSTPSGSIPHNLLYYLAAFVVGYREETFRELIKRLTDVLFAQGGAGTTGMAISSMSTYTGPATGGTQVTVLGTGLRDTSSVRFGTAPAKFRIDGDTQITVTSPPGTAGATVNVTVTGKAAAHSAGTFTYT